jgi:hypothetical protein
MLMSPERFHFWVSLGFTYIALSVEGSTSTPGVPLESHVTVWHFNLLSYVRRLSSLLLHIREMVSSYVAGGGITRF